MSASPFIRSICPAIGLAEMRRCSTAELRDHSLIESRFDLSQIRATYTHYDRTDIDITPIA